MRSWPALVVVFGVLHPAPEADDAESVAGRLQAALTDFAVSAIEERHGGGWRVFFHDAGSRDRALAVLPREFPRFAFRAEDVPDEDWAARSQASLRAVRVGRLVVAPPWDVPEDAGAGVLVVVPSMGFGTGHHATTRLCLAALQAVDLAGRTVLDAGTGSGVLAMAASRLGAGAVHAFDDDPDAVAAARDNLARNPAASVAVRVADLRRDDLPPADVVIANLTGGLLCAAADRLTGLTRSGGRLILSGFLLDEEAAVVAAFPGCAVEARAAEDEWGVLTLRRPTSP